MKRVLLVLGASIISLHSLSGAKVQADAIHWSATGGPTGPNLDSDNGTASVNSLNYGSNASIDLVPGAPTNGTNAGSVILSVIGAYFNLPNEDDARFGGATGNYSLNLVLHDLTSGASGSLTFHGNFSGTIPGGDVYVTNTFIGPTTQTLTLGRNLYTVMIGPYVTPQVTNPPFTGEPGSISASISVEPVVKTASNPEPSSLVLACLGLPSLGVAHWFRRRRRS